MPSAAESTQNSNSSRTRTIILVLISFCCGILFCASLLMGSGFYFMQGQAQTVLATIAAQLTPTAMPTNLTPTVVTPIVTTPIVSPTLTTAPPTELPTATLTPTTVMKSNKSQFSQLIFALDATEDDYTPINSGLTFSAAITEIHAIFDYEGMSTQAKWERVWYHNDKEILRNSAAWSGQEKGRFDYFIDAGGNPLPSGYWRLELYVDRKMLISGTFTIGQVLDTPTVTATASNLVQVTVTPRATPATAAVTILPTPTAIILPTAPSNQVYQLTFTKWDGGQHNMYVADTNGQNEKFILNRAAGPSWSDDGQQIFFFGEEGIDRQILKDRQEVLFDGISNGLVALTNASALPDPTRAKLFQDISWKRGSARWANVSSDGQMVAFDAWVVDTYRIYIIATNPQDTTRFELLGEQGDWSPDSQRLVYRSGRNGTTGIWISNRNDSGHLLITNGGSDSFPTWSPDGQTVVFSRDDGGNVDLYAMNPDGTNLHRLTDAAGPDTLPVFMPNGQLIFRSARGGYWSIWKMYRDGSGQTEIISNAPVGPDWSYSRMDVR